MTTHAEKEQLRIERLLREMTRDAVRRYPFDSVSDLFQHIDGAMQIMQDTQRVLYAVRLAIVKDEYDKLHSESD
jgi:hypothetical protein